jgi:predicted branched-subunit amino acid permease
VTDEQVLHRDDREIRRALERRALSVVLAVAPFGLVFGAAASTAGLTMLEAFGSWAMADRSPRLLLPGCC